MFSFRDKVNKGAVKIFRALTIVENVKDGINDIFTHYMPKILMEINSNAIRTRRNIDFEVLHGSDNFIMSEKVSLADSTCHL